jgi:hypothetical protein
MLRPTTKRSIKPQPALPIAIFAATDHLVQTIKGWTEEALNLLQQPE